MNLYNTLSKKTEEIASLKGKEIRMYSCGPTVYDHIHIGNLASFIFTDTLHRALRCDGYKVKHVMNYTDVDDKTIHRSKETYPDLEPMEALRKLTEEYSALFLEDMKAVGNDTSNISFVKATDNIEAVQTLIRELHKNGFAYIADDGVYFSIAAYRKSGKTYGQLSKITASSTAEARIHNDEYDKESAHDFALWKKQKPHEPAWDFDISGQDMKGRPGWHIECSAMSASALGQPFDIHTGGVDLIFPHHENEIAQSTAGMNSPLYAKVFVHNEHLLVDGQKMAKSLSNFYTLQDVRDKGVDPLAFRLLVLQSHYRHQSHFSWENLQAAQNRLKNFRALAALRWQPRSFTHDSSTFALEDIPKQLARLLADDLDMPSAMAFLSQISTQLLTVHIERDMVGHFETMLSDIDDLLGLNLWGVPDISVKQKGILGKREKARAEQDWALADQLRGQLESEGIGLHDAVHGAIWFWL